MHSMAQVHAPSGMTSPGGGRCGFIVARSAGGSRSRVMVKVKGHTVGVGYGRSSGSWSRSRLELEVSVLEGHQGHGQSQGWSWRSVYKRSHSPSNNIAKSDGGSTTLDTRFCQFFCEGKLARMAFHSWTTAMRSSAAGGRSDLSGTKQSAP